MERKKTPRILVAGPGLNGHDFDTMAFALAFRNAGFEVIYTGGHQTPQQILSSALQEAVDIIALSGLASSYTFSFQRVLRLLKDNDAVDITVIYSGNSSLEDIPKLKEMWIEVCSPKQNLLNRLIPDGMQVNNN